MLIMVNYKSGLIFLIGLCAGVHWASGKSIRAVSEEFNWICPIHEELNEFNSTTVVNNNTRVIDLGLIPGKKLKVQFYTPNPVKALAKHLEETTLAAYPFFGEDTTLGTEIVTVGLADATEINEETTTTLATEKVEVEQNPPDIMCQWEFLAANVSEYILLTFHDMSAPYSDDCADAYVSLQKDNGYESRWCGNRRQTFAFGLPNFAFVNWRYVRSPAPGGKHGMKRDANARPMSLVSKTKATITVLRKGKAAAFPPTGFALTVESLDVFSMAGVDNSLRVLLG